ncbi:hypothetical protein [Prevotella nigrescens]|uniref:hypothetical protein n=1 Tax=Prevotella nigrescens TaxID=28133 RepID=UPI0028DD1E82|nr:hypothetical protein [Prevotella nigrescens]
MKMKRYQLLVLHVVALFALAGCSNDDITQDKGTQESEDLTGMTEFAVKETPASTSTRTMGIYSGSGIDFYWTSGDKLWINNPTATPALVESKKDNISKLLAEGDGKKTATAKFYFLGTYTAPSYKVRYTGNGNTMSDKVTIKSVQNQETPNDGSHIGTDGDCGTATATRNGERYDFTLSHKASYLTFTPYYSHGFTKDVKVTQIKVTADKPMAGTYKFDDAGIQTDNATSTSTSITLKLKGGGDNGFIIPKEASYADNAAIMVLAPGIYKNFTVEYTLYDQVTHVRGTVSKNYGRLYFYEGKNKIVAADLDIVYRGDKLYMWDAKQDYWYGYESEQPAINGVSGTHYPKNKTADPMRWYNDVNLSSGQSYTATGKAAVCPNVNEMAWYIFKGAPHWDSDKLFSFAGHLSKGGMWFKKKAVIMSENHLTDEAMKAKYDNTDYRSYRPSIPNWSLLNKSITIGAPSNVDNYFFLPAIGYFFKGSFYSGSFIQGNQNGLYGDYWTSSASNLNGNENAYNLAFRENVVGIYVSSRLKGAMTIAFE